MQGIVCHWNAGTHQASELDKEHYHVIIEGDGRLVRGDHSITDNMLVGDGDYAAHTGRHNTRMIGVAVACMGGSLERPWRPGKWPMTEKQWNTMMVVCADLVERYRIQVAPKTLCGHGAIYDHYGQVNKTGKWDPLVLPWQRSLSKTSVDQLIRDQVTAILGGRELGKPGKEPVRIPTQDRPILTTLNGTLLTDDAFNKENRIWVPVRLLESVLKFLIVDTDGQQVLIRRADGETRRLDFLIVGNTGFCRIADIKNLIGGVDTAWDPETRTLNLIVK
jgi:hypothetical protein